MTVKFNTSKSGKKQGNGFKDITGQRFGRLVVLRKIGKAKNRQIIWECQCDCGNKVPVRGDNLRREIAQSCGCLRKEHQIKAVKTHGMYKSTEYTSWCSMKDRCKNPKASGYENYGGRGILVCENWLKFKNFFKDMGFKPTPTHSVERINNNKGYYKENCKWATPTEQSQNKRARKENITGIVGVNWYKRTQRYRATISFNHEPFHLGYFIDIEDAIIARRAGELKYWNKSEV